MYVDTSPAAIEQRALQSMLGKHQLQMDSHQLRFGFLGEPMNKQQKQALKRALKEQEAAA